MVIVVITYLSFIYEGNYHIIPTRLVIAEQVPGDCPFGNLYELKEIFHKPFVYFISFYLLILSKVEFTLLSS